MISTLTNDVGKFMSQNTYRYYIYVYGYDNVDIFNG